MNPTLYLIRGIPGSGKTTFANLLHSKGTVMAVFEADQYFFSRNGEYIFDPKLLPEAHKWCQDHVIMYLEQGFSVAVSNTSTTEKEVDTYKKIAEDYGADFISLIVENRHGGKNVHNVPEEKIQQMKNRFSIKL